MSMKIVAMITFHEYLSKSTAADDGREEGRKSRKRLEELNLSQHFHFLMITKLSSCDELLRVP